MTAKALAQTFSALSSDEQAGLVAQWSHLLTIDARDTYIPGTQGIADPVRLRGFNEIQHRVSSQLLSILEADDKRCPDDVFLNNLVESAQELRALLLQTELEKWGKTHGEVKRRRIGMAAVDRAIARRRYGT
jgi:hypothetical protein